MESEELFGTEAGLQVERVPPQEMLALFQDVNIAAPMVRYSKLPFRHLVSLYDCHITHTPMIVAAEFSRSATARLTDFSTSTSERGVFEMIEEPTNDTASGRKRRVKGALIAQFAASDPRIFADASELIWPHVDGIDLNCGCPQLWAWKEELGCWLTRQPDRVRDLIRAAKGRLGWSYPISIKIRVSGDLRKTEHLVQTAIHAGVSHITVHGRTRRQTSSEPVSLASISFAVQASKGEVPIVANGDAWDLDGVRDIRRETKVRGVMAARGLLANPALFSGSTQTPLEAVKRFVDISSGYGLVFPLFHRHLSFMLETQLSRQERLYFNALAGYGSVIDSLASMEIVKALA